MPAYEGGIVLDQLPEGGVEVKPGRTVYITINSFRQKMVPVPYVAGRSLRQAKNMLESRGLEIGELIYRADMATNYVLGRVLRRASRHREQQHSGRNGQRRNALRGRRAVSFRRSCRGWWDSRSNEAKGRLWELGLNVGKIYFDEGINLLNQKEARVYVQTPSAEAVRRAGFAVDLKLTLDDDKVTRPASRYRR